jgi:hypothetical protein
MTGWDFAKPNTIVIERRNDEAIADTRRDVARYVSTFLAKNRDF